jgi:hypothetical protein
MSGLDAFSVLSMAIFNAAQDCMTPTARNSVLDHALRGLHNIGSQKGKK